MDIIKKLRGDMTFREMSKRTGINHTYLNKLENGIKNDCGKERKPTTEVLRKLEKAYDIDYVELLVNAGYVTVDDLKKHYESSPKYIYDDSSKTTESYTEKNLNHVQQYEILYLACMQALRSLNIEIDEQHEEFSDLVVTYSDHDITDVAVSLDILKDLLMKAKYVELIAEYETE